MAVNITSVDEVYLKRQGDMHYQLATRKKINDTSKGSGTLVVVIVEQYSHTISNPALHQLSVTNIQAIQRTRVIYLVNSHATFLKAPTNFH